MGPYAASPLGLPPLYKLEPREAVFLGSGWRAKTDGMGHSAAQGAAEK